MSSYVQSNSTLFWFKTIAPCPATTSLVKKSLFLSLISPFYVLKCHNKVFSEPALLQAEQPQLFEPYFRGVESQTLFFWNCSSRSITFLCCVSLYERGNMWPFREWGSRSVHLRTMDLSYTKWHYFLLHQAQSICWFLLKQWVSHPSFLKVCLVSLYGFTGDGGSGVNWYVCDQEKILDINPR